MNLVEVLFSSGVKQKGALILMFCQSCSLIQTFERSEAPKATFGPLLLLVTHETHHRLWYYYRQILPSLCRTSQSNWN